MHEILAISRNVDLKRRKQLVKKMQEALLDFEFFDAVNGHNFEELRPFVHLLPQQFWGKPQIKPGAFACFISHYLAWKNVSEAKRSKIIIEDDVRPLKIHISHFDKDLVYINRRMFEWAKLSGGFENIIESRAHKRFESEYHAPGADAYFITPKAARMLVECAEKYLAFIGVDWFLLAMGSDFREIHQTNDDEISILQNAFGGLSPQVEMEVHSSPIFHIRKQVPSAILHRESIELDVLRRQLIG